MKTAEQWQSEMVVGNTTGIATIKEIQQDAWRQGMTDAAAIVRAQPYQSADGHAQTAREIEDRKESIAS